MQTLETIPTHVPVEKILPPKHLLRTEYSRVDVLRLAESIKEKGLLQPIVVRQTYNGYELIAGCRRLKAFKQLGLQSIPSIVVEASDSEAMEIGLIENVQHQSLTPVEEAIAYKRYIDEFGYGSVSRLAEKISKSQEYVSHRLSLLKLSKEILDSVMRRRISASIAQELLPLSSIQQRRLASLASEGQLTKRQVRKEVKLCLSGGDIDHAKISATQETTSPISLVGSAHDTLFIDKSISVLKSTLYQMDEIIDTISDSNLFKEIMLESRFLIHGQMDSLLKMKRKIKHYEKRPL